MASLSFIGMSGVGKSTIGKDVARRLSLTFVDTDLLIERETGQRLQETINEIGDTAFMALEERVVMSLSPFDNLVVSTGGSVIYSETAMADLSAHTSVIYLHDNLANIKARLKNIQNRGIVGLGKQSYDDLYHQRLSLYQRYADVTVTLPKKFNKSAITQSVLSAIEAPLTTS